MVILKFFGIIILFVVIFFLMMILSVVFRFWGFFRQLTSGQQTNSQQGQYNQQQGQYGQRDQWYRGDNFSSSDNNTSSTQTVSGQPKPRNSEVDKNEGEYVEFEEIP